MQQPLREAFEAEMAHAVSARRTGELALAFHHLERAHVLSQRFVVPHVRSHLGMFWVGLLRWDLREIVGQALRIPGAALGSALGHVPEGNTGGANVHPFRAMPVPEDLKALLEEHR